MNESLFDKLVEISWRRRLTPAEAREVQAWLAGHPEAAERWEAEAGLNQAMEGLKPVASRSNFTRQVLELVELDQRAARRQATWSQRFRRAFSVQWPRMAWAAAIVVVAAGLGYHQYREYSQDQVARGMRSLSTVAAVTAVTEPEVLEDFEAIRQFSHVRAETDQTDEALFALLGGN